MTYVRNCITHHICDCNYEKMKSLEKEIKKLKLENTVLKEKLSVAESQIEDLKSQVAYFENGEQCENDA